MKDILEASEQVVDIFSGADEFDALPEEEQVEYSFAICITDKKTNRTVIETPAVKSVKYAIDTLNGFYIGTGYRAILLAVGDNDSKSIELASLDLSLSI